MSKLSTLQAENERLTELSEKTREINLKLLDQLVELSTRLERVAIAQTICQTIVVAAHETFKDSSLSDKTHQFAGGVINGASRCESLLAKALNTDEDLMTIAMLGQDTAPGDGTLH